MILEHSVNLGPVTTEGGADVHRPRQEGCVLHVKGLPLDPEAEKQPLEGLYRERTEPIVPPRPPLRRSVDSGSEAASLTGGRPGLHS